MHAFVVLPLVIFALALRARGIRFHWWVLPSALGLVYWMAVDGGRSPAFLGATGAFLIAVFIGSSLEQRRVTAPAKESHAVGARALAAVADEVRRGAPAPAHELRVSPTPAAPAAPPQPGARASAPAPSAPAPSATGPSRTIRFDPATGDSGLYQAVPPLRLVSDEPAEPRTVERGTPPPPPTGTSVGRPTAAPEPTPARPAAPTQAAPPRPAASGLRDQLSRALGPVLSPRSGGQRSAPRDLLAQLVPHASPEQRARLWPQLRADREIVCRGEGEPAQFRPTRAAWGREVVPGVRLHWDFLEAPSDTTILAVWCRDDEGQRMIALVPTDLAGVKRLEQDGEPMRWAGRGVFVAAHLLLRGD